MPAARRRAHVCDPPLVREGVESALWRLYQVIKWCGGLHLYGPSVSCQIHPHTHSTSPRPPSLYLRLGLLLLDRVGNGGVRELGHVHDRRHGRIGWGGRGLGVLCMCVCVVCNGQFKTIRALYSSRRSMAVALGGVTAPFAPLERQRQGQWASRAEAAVPGGGLGQITP